MDFYINKYKNFVTLFSRENTDGKILVSQITSIPTETNLYH